MREAKVREKISRTSAGQATERTGTAEDVEPAREEGSMSDEWKASEVPFKNTAAFEDLHPEVQKHIRHAREWAMVEGGWEAIVFVDEPHGNQWSVRRCTDELGTEEIEVVEIRYVERRFPVATQEREG